LEQVRIKVLGLRRNLWVKDKDKKGTKAGSAVEAATAMEKAKRCAAFPTAVWKSTQHFSTAPPAPGAVTLTIYEKGYAPWLESCIWYHDEATPKQEGQDQGASEDYSESCAEIQIFRLWRDTVGRNERRDGSAGGDLSTPEQ
jgi:hypothetical protein